MDNDQQEEFENFLKLRTAVKIDLLDCFKKIDKETGGDGEMIIFIMIYSLIEPLFGIQESLKDIHFTRDNLIEYVQNISDKSIIELTKKIDEE